MSAYLRTIQTCRLYPPRTTAGVEPETYFFCGGVTTRGSVIISRVKTFKIYGQTRSVMSSILLWFNRSFIIRLRCATRTARDFRIERRVHNGTDETTLQQHLFVRRVAPRATRSTRGFGGRRFSPLIWRRWNASKQRLLPPSTPRNRMSENVIKTTTIDLCCITKDGEHVIYYDLRPGPMLIWMWFSNVSGTTCKRHGESER